MMLLGFFFFRESWVRHIDAASKLFLDTEKQKREKLYNCEYYVTFSRFTVLFCESKVFYHQLPLVVLSIFKIILKFYF